MTKLHDIHALGQSPWLDNLRRDWLQDGTIQRRVDEGVRGITSNPSIFQKAMTAGDAYDDDIRAHASAGSSVDDAYWSMVVDDIRSTLTVLRPVHDSSGGADGFVSLEVAPALAGDEAGTTAAARAFFEQIADPNLMVKIPGTAEGLGSIRQMVSEGRNINVTLLFTLERYAEVMDAYLGGLEAYDGDLAQVHSVASFFVSRVDTEIDRRLDAVGTDEALALRGRGAVAQAKLAYQLFRETFSGPRWDALAARGANVQRPLWASTSTKNPGYPTTLYVDTLIGPDTVNTMPEATIDAFEAGGTVARTVDDGVDDARAAWDAIGRLVDLDDVGRTLEDEGVAAFVKSFDEVLSSLQTKLSEIG
jgi:transaldolase